MASHRTPAVLTARQLAAAALTGLLGLLALALMGSNTPTYTTATAAYGEPIPATAPAKPAPAKHQTAAIKHHAAAKPAPAEDSTGWHCAQQGNRTCGPGNPDGATPGCYVNGQLVAAWTPDMYGRWHNCGPETAYDRLQERRLSGQVPQVCTPNAQGGTTCTWKD